MLSKTLPFRLRPIHNPDIETLLPFGMNPEVLDGWSSMPSDHAVLFFSFAACIFLINRAFGIVLLLHAALVVCLPRIYAGVHFPSDVVVGALVGIALAVALLKPFSLAIEKYHVLQLERTYAFFFYPVAFLITFQAASMFDSVRSLLQILLRIIF